MIMTIIYTFLAIIALVLSIALFIKKEYSLSSSIVINRSRADVFNFVKNLKNQEQYSKWVMADPNVQLNYQGSDGTVGFIAAWKSENKNVGVGEQEITAIHEGDGYEVEIRFKKPFEGISKAHVTTEALGDQQTSVTTTFYTKTPFPMNLMIPMIKNMLQKDMDQNSATLKAVLEKS